MFKLIQSLIQPQGRAQPPANAPARSPFALRLRQIDLRDLELIAPGLGADTPASTYSPCLTCRYYAGEHLRCAPNPVGTVRNCKDYSPHVSKVLGVNLYSLIYLDGDWVEVSPQAGRCLDKLLQAGQPLPQEFNGIRPKLILCMMTLDELKSLAPGRPGITAIVERLDRAKVQQV